MQVSVFHDNVTHQHHNAESVHVASRDNWLCISDDDLAMIVRAVNNHQRLLDACDLANNYLAGLARQRLCLDSQRGDGTLLTWEETQQTLYAAIDAAE